MTPGPSGCSQPGFLTGGDHHSLDQLAGVEAALYDLGATEQGVSLVLLCAVGGGPLRPGAGKGRLGDGHTLTWWRKAATR